MTSNLPSLLLVGCGQMGGALFEAWQKNGLAPSVVIDRHRHSVAAPHRLARSLSEIPEDFVPMAIVLAVKPQKALATLVELATTRPALCQAAVFVSVMAGFSTASVTAAIDSVIPGATPGIVRAMPNTPSAIGRGMTGLFANTAATDHQKALCECLLASVGATVWVPAEDQINVVTAISGSGPAYVFLLAELLERTAIEQGLTPDVSRLLARKTVSGAGELLDRAPDDAAELRRKVTSPGGTTAEAIAILNAPENWPSTLSRAIEAAVRRARELAA